MELGAIVPTTKLFGGVKRFLELGNACLEKGHGFTLFTPDGCGPSWYDYRGDVGPIGGEAARSLDALFVTETRFLEALVRSGARVKGFYYVMRRADLSRVLRHPEITVFANSSDLFEHARRRYGITPVKAFGGIDCDFYRPASERTGPREGPVRVLAYGRLSRKRKGTRFVVRACERLYRKGFDIKLVLFDTPPDQEARRLAAEFSCKVPHEFLLDIPYRANPSIYHGADLFVSAEKDAGWCNTCAEAMACGLPVAATPSGTTDFLIDRETGLRVRRNSFSIGRALQRLIADQALCRKLAHRGRERIEVFNWERLAGTILSYVDHRTGYGNQSGMENTPS